MDYAHSGVCDRPTGPIIFSCSMEQREYEELHARALASPEGFTRGNYRLDRLGRSNACQGTFATVTIKGFRVGILVRRGDIPPTNHLGQLNIKLEVLQECLFRRGGCAVGW
jgi:hypothetical protein